MKRLRHVNGTKERPRGRECLTFGFANYGAVIVDRVHPDDRGKMFARLWAHYGSSKVWVSYRRMQAGETYAPLDIPADTEQAAA